MTVSLDLGFRRRKDRKCFRCVKRWKPPLGPQGVPHTYHAILQEELGVKKPTTLNGLEDVLQQSVRRINTTSKLPKPKPVWQNAVLQDLLQRRRAAHDRSERTNLSKVIRKHLRRNMRRRRNARVSQILAEFQDLGRLDSAHNAPIRRVATANPGPTPEMFRGFLGNIFMSDTGHDTATLAGLDDADCLDLVPPFTLQELGTVLRDLHYGRAADADGMVAGMFKYSNIPLQECLLNMYNSMLASGSFETSWQHTLFTMLPKPGDSSQPNNWRPIAVLKITYKIFSRLLYNRLRVVMDDQQPYDQTGFRPNTGIDDAFVVLECLSSKSLEWNAPIWFASLDLTKAFDRIEYSPLFDALLQQGVPRSYCTLLWKLYKGQTGSVHGSERFTIERGVKQGDVISPILFNAGLEHAMRKWKAKLFHHGVQLGHGNRLTNIRYADDLMLFATSSKDLIYMLETLIPELAACGLQLNSAKTKILTTSPLNTSEFVDVCGEMVQVIHAESVHKYLGRNLTANFLARRDIEFAHRLQVAWNKFQKYKHVLLNKHISLVLRLKFFDAVVSPAMLFGLATLPLTKVCLQKLGVVQRRMLRSIVGWVRIHDDQNWRDIMLQMNHRMAIANILFPMEDWEDRLFRSKFRLAHRIARSPEAWPAKSASWNPLTNWESNFACMPQRKRGRPSARWDDTLTNFSTEFFRNEKWWQVASEASLWFTSERFYVQFCRAHFGL